MTTMERPAIFIAAGTGIAPIRGMIRERLHRAGVKLEPFGAAAASAAASAADPSPFAAAFQPAQYLERGRDNCLVFGCRTMQDDYLYGAEWSSAVSSSSSSTSTSLPPNRPPALGVVLSLSQGPNGSKRYVQRALRESTGREILARHILEDGGCVYIAGGARMAQAVKEEIVEAIMHVVKGGRSEAVAIVSAMRRKGLLAIEAWS